MNAKAKRSSIIFDTNQLNLLSQKLVYNSQAMTVERQAQQEESGEISSVHAVGNKAVAFLAKTRLPAEMMVKKQAKVQIDREDRQTTAVEAKVAKKVAQAKSRADMEEVPCTIPFPSASMRLVYGRRRVLIPSRKKETRNEFENMPISQFLLRL